MLIPTYFGKLQHFLSAVLESAKSGIDSFIVELWIMPISIILRFINASASASAFIVNKIDIRISTYYVMLHS